jgi:hypothetical protein
MELNIMDEKTLSKVIYKDEKRDIVNNKELNQIGEEILKNMYKKCNVLKDLENLDYSLIQLDTETYFDDPNNVKDKSHKLALDVNLNSVRLLILEDKKGYNVCLDMDKYVNKNNNTDEASKNLNYIIEKLLSIKYLIGHNLNFDLGSLRKYSYIVPIETTIWDTHKAEQVLSGTVFKKNSVENSLLFIVKSYCGKELDKTNQTCNWSLPLTEDKIRYAREDVKYLLEIKLKQEILLKGIKVDTYMPHIYNTLYETALLENECVKVFVEMCHNGICISKNKDERGKTAIENCLSVVKVELDDLKHKIMSFVDENYQVIDLNIEQEYKEPYNSELHKHFIFGEERNLILKTCYDFPKVRPSHITNEKDFIASIENDDEKYLYTHSKKEKDLREWFFVSGKDFTCKLVVLSSQPRLLWLINQYRRMNGQEEINGTGKDILRYYREDNNFYDYILRYNKRKSFYNGLKKLFKDKMDPQTYKIFPTFISMGAETGRTSSKEPNLQGFSKGKECRSLFVPDKGSIWIISDFSQVELRISAVYVDDKFMLNSFDPKKEEDLHVKIMSIIRKQPYEEIKALEKSDPKQYKTIRAPGKAINFGNLYGMGPDKFYEYSKFNFGISDMTPQFANQCHKEYHNNYKQVDNWHKEIKKQIQNKKEFTTWTMYGRKRVIKDDNLFNAALNTPIQGTGADIIKLSLTSLYKYIQSNNECKDYKIKATIHDEIILQVPDTEEHKKRGSLLLKSCMELSGQQISDKIPFTAEPFICKSWHDKEYDNNKFVNYTQQELEEFKQNILEYDEEQFMKELDKSNKDKENLKNPIKLDIQKLEELVNKNMSETIKSEDHRMINLSEDLEINIDELKKNKRYYIDKYEAPIIHTFDNKYQDEIIWSPMNTQKTRTTIKYLKEHYLDKKILIFTSRKSFGRSLNKEFEKEGLEGFVFYEDFYNIKMKGSKTEKDQQWEEKYEKLNRFILQVESFWKNDLFIPDIIIIDEITSILAQLHSKLHKNKLKENHDEFENMIRNVDKIIGMDADIDMRTIYMLEMLRYHNNEEKQKGKVRLQINTANKKYILDENPIVKQQLNPLYRDKPIRGVRINTIEEAYAKIIQSVLEKKKLYIVLGCKNYGDILLKYLKKYKSILPPEKIFFYNREEDDEKIKNLDCSTWNNAFIVMATSTITNGVNFADVHFDEMIVLSSSRSVYVRDLKQMMGRCRWLKHNLVYYFINDIKHHYPITIKGVNDSLEKKLRLFSTLLQSIGQLDTYSFLHQYSHKVKWVRQLDYSNFFVILYALCKVEINKSKNNCLNLFEEMLISQGYELTELECKWDKQQREDKEEERRTNQALVNDDIEYNYKLSIAPTKEDIKKADENVKKGQATKADKFILIKSEFLQYFDEEYKGIQTKEELLKEIEEIKINNPDIISEREAIDQVMKLPKYVNVVTSNDFMNYRGKEYLIKYPKIELAIYENTVSLTNIAISEINKLKEITDTKDIYSFKSFLCKLYWIQLICTKLGLKHSLDTETKISDETMNENIKWFQDNKEIINRTFSKRDQSNKDKELTKATISRYIQSIFNCWCSNKIDSTIISETVKSIKEEGKKKQIRIKVYEHNILVEQNYINLMDKYKEIDFNKHKYQYIKFLQ